MEIVTSSIKELYVVKIGGKIAEEEELLRRTLDAFAALPHPKMLVHGGGSQANRLCERLGIPKKMAGGRRITDEATLEVVTMIYAGSMNKKIVSLLQALNCDAIGLSGADANCILAEKRRPGTIDYGFAGDILAVNNRMLTRLLGLGLVPVLCAITHDGKGQLLNTNADTIASEVASRMVDAFSVKLWLCMRLRGVLLDASDEESLIADIDQKTFEAYIKNGIVADGMIPKLENAFSAVDRGVDQVGIGNILGLIQDVGTFLGK